MTIEQKLSRLSQYMGKASFSAGSDRHAAFDLLDSIWKDLNMPSGEFVELVSQRAIALAAPAAPQQGKRARYLFAELYQILGALDALVRVLDQVSAAANGESIPDTDLLPFEAPQQGVVMPEYLKTAEAFRSHLLNMEWQPGMSSKWGDIEQFRREILSLARLNADRSAQHDSDCSTNNRSCPDLLGPCDCSLSKKP